MVNEVAAIYADSCSKEYVVIQETGLKKLEMGKISGNLLEFSEILPNFSLHTRN